MNIIPMTNIARILAVVAAFVAGTLVKFAAQHGITLSADELVVVINTVMLAAYAVVHRLISRKSNPEDVASPEIRRTKAGE